MMSNASTDHADDHGHGHDHGHADDGAVHAHISSFGFLAGIFAVLIMFTFITVAVSYVDLGAANTVVAVLIATIKAGLVSLFFMHLRYDKVFHGLIFISAFVFLGLFLTYTNDDLDTRGRVDDASGTTEYRGERAGGGMPQPAEAPAAHGAAPAGGEHGAGAAAPAAGEHGH
jgi:cytochrome c oxidase subunit 4